MRGTGAGRQGGGARREKAAKFFRSQQDGLSYRLVTVKPAIQGVVFGRSKFREKGRKIGIKTVRKKGPSVLE